MTLEPPGEFEFEQHRLHERGCEARLADQFVDCDWNGAEQFRDSAAISVAGVERGRTAEWMCGRANRTGVDRAEHFEDVVY